MPNYYDISAKVFYRENKEELNKNYSEDTFLKINNSDRKEISKKLNLDFKYIITIDSVNSFFPIVENFIINSGIDDIHLDRATVVYLGMCALAIKFDIPKEKYRKLFTELRLRNVYGLLENLTIFIDKMNNIFNYITGLVNNTSYDIVGMFNHYSLFIPLSLTMADLFKTNKVDLEFIINTIGDNSLTELSTVEKTDKITLINLIVELVKNLIKFSTEDLDESYNEIKDKINNYINKIKINVNDVKKDMESKNIKEVNPESSDILKWDQWKTLNDVPVGMERIDEEK